MPIEEMAKDSDFPKKWMFGMACMLKKGLHLHQIHQIDRPFAEMMLGLESWIPMYMTGQISPYYLKENTGQTFMHLLKVPELPHFRVKQFMGITHKDVIISQNIKLKYLITKKWLSCF